MSPLMNHAARRPSVFCQTISGLPSPSRSPLPTSFQSGEFVAASATSSTADTPFIFHRLAAPLVCRHTRSALPSALKSALPAAAILFRRTQAGGVVRGGPPSITVTLLLRLLTT